MRYDGLLRAIEAARLRYESSIQEILSQAFKQDVATGMAIRDLVKEKHTPKAKRGPYKKKRKAPHWTQRPENRKKVEALHRKMQKAKAAKAAE